MEKVVQIGTPVCKPPVESEGAEVKASAPETPNLAEKEVKIRKRK